MNQEQLLGIIRHTLTIVGAVLITNGTVDESNWTIITGSTLGLVGLIWSILDKSPTVKNYFAKKK